MRNFPRNHDHGTRYSGRPSASFRRIKRSISVRARRTGGERLPSAPAGGFASVRTILVPLELDDRSSGLLLKAASFARQLGAQLVLLHVYRARSYAPRYITARQFDEGQAAQRRIAEEQTRAFLDTCGHLPEIRSARVVVEPGFITDKIQPIADAIEADLIILTSHSHTGIQRMGSKAACIARHAHQPVLVVPDCLVRGAKVSGMDRESRWTKFWGHIKRFLLSASMFRTY